MSNAYDHVNVNDFLKHFFIFKYKCKLYLHDRPTKCISLHLPSFTQWAYVYSHLPTQQCFKQTLLTYSIKKIVFRNLIYD